MRIFGGQLYIFLVSNLILIGYFITYIYESITIGLFKDSSLSMDMEEIIFKNCIHKFQQRSPHFKNLNNIFMYYNFFVVSKKN